MEEPQQSLTRVRILTENWLQIFNCKYKAFLPCVPFMYISNVYIHFLTWFTAVIYSLTLSYLTLPFVPMIVEWLTNANETTYGLLFHIEGVVDVEKYYTIITIHSVSTTILVMTIPIATDSMMVIYVEHACGMFAALRYNMDVEITNKGCFWGNFSQFKIFHFLGINWRKGFR